MNRPAGPARYLDVGTRVQWVTAMGMQAISFVGTILPEPLTGGADPLDDDFKARPELRWVQWDDDTNGPELVAVDELSADQ